MNKQEEIAKMIIDLITIIGFGIGIIWIANILFN